jgi:hypothetical protein
MRRLRLFDRGSVAPLALVAGVLVSILALSGAMLSRPVEMRLEPDRILVAIGETFEMRVFVSAPVPVNVYYAAQSP